MQLTIFNNTWLQGEAKEIKITVSYLKRQSNIKRKHCNEINRPTYTYTTDKNMN